MNERVEIEDAECVAENARAQERGSALIEMIEANTEDQFVRIMVSGNSREAITSAIETLLAAPDPSALVGLTVKAEPLVDSYEEEFLCDLCSVLAACSEFMGEEGPAFGCPGALALADRAEAMLAQVVAWPDDRRPAKAEQPSKPLAALAHSLDCAADSCAERGLAGWEVTIRRAAGFVAAVENSVTRLLPAGTEVRHPSYDAPLAVASLQCFDSGRIRVICTGPGSGMLSVPLDEIEPIFELDAAGIDPQVRSLVLAARGVRCDEAGWDQAETDRRWAALEAALDPFSAVEPTKHRYDGPLHHGLDRDGEEKIREFIGQEQAAESTVHHLSVDPDQRVTIHGFDRASPNGDHSALVTRDALTGQITGIEYGCGDDEFPS